MHGVCLKTSIYIYICVCVYVLGKFGKCVLSRQIIRKILILAILGPKLGYKSFYQITPLLINVLVMYYVSVNLLNKCFHCEVSGDDKLKIARSNVKHGP